ncbi:MAG: tetratricopeptide repeat protein [Pelolinea sp.]|nr:tetratricopeptide repeat protein [Pelolinea sp.]
MDQFDILFALKDILRDTCGKQVISRLLQFPLICEYLSDSVNLQCIADYLGEESRLWTPANICKIATEVSLEPTQSNISDYLDNKYIESFLALDDLASLQKSNSLNELYPIVQHIASQKNKTSWQGIFDQIGLQSYLFNDPKKILETVLSVVYEISDNKIELVNGLLGYSGQDSGPKLLAHLLMMDESIGEILINTSKTTFPNTSVNNFALFIKELQFLGDQKYYAELSRKFLEIIPLDERISQNKNAQAFQDELKKLLYLKNYAALFQIANDKKEAERLSSIAKMVLASVEKKFGFVSNSRDSNNQNIEGINYNSEILISDQNSEPYGSELTQEINRIKRIAKTDFESAITIADEVYKKLLKDCDLANSIFHKDFGFIIKPEELTQVFIDLGLFIQAQAISNLLLKCWPQNIQLLRKAANLANDNGDHQAAISQFSQIYIIDALSREEKIKLALSLEYAGRWKGALEIRKGINTTNDNDIIDEAVCAYYAGNLEVLESLISENRIEIQSSSTILLLREILKNGEGQISNFEERVIPRVFIRENDQKGILLIADHLQDAGEYDKAIQVLEEYVRNSLFSFSIVNRLHDLYQRTGDSEKSRLVMDADLENECSDQKTFEIYVENLIHSGNIDKADQFLARYSNKWELSTRKLDLKAKIFIEKRKFQQAKKILHSLVDTNNCDEDCLFDYYLASLECSLSDFPFGINTKNSNRIDEIKEIIDLRNKKEGIFLELLEAELASDDQLGKYQQLLQKYSEGHNPEVWRIFAGLGKVYFNQKQYDSAIINIKRAYGTMSDNESLLWLLIRSYANLRLWNEIENLFNTSQILDKRSLFKGLMNFEVFSDSSEWSRFLENQVQKKPDETIYKIVLSQSLIVSGKKTEAVKLMKSFYEDLNVEDEFYLSCAQTLIDADEPLLAERLIEIYLSNKKTLEQNDYVSSAFLYEQLGKSEKSLVMINHLELKDPVLLTYKAKLLNDSGNLNQSQKLINIAIEKNEVEEFNLQDIFAHIPEIVKSIQINPALVYIIASSLELNNKNIDKAISFLEKGLYKHPENQEILFNLLELLNITGKNEDINKIISENSQALVDIHSPYLSCLMGEITLSHKEEVTGACYLSASMKIGPNYPRVKALQARMVAINGNILEAQKIFNCVKEELKETEAGQEIIFQSVGQVETNSKLWLAKAALDLKDHRTALQISQQEIDNFGIYPPSIILFLSAFASLLEEEFILSELNVNNHLKPIEDDGMTTFSTIVENLSKAHSDNKEINNLATRCQIYLENDSEIINKAEKLAPEINNINSIIFGIYKSKGQEAAEIAFNSHQTDPNHELFLAILEKDDNPQKALSHLKQVINRSMPDVRAHALLAIIEKNLGNFLDAYAAVSLALDQWPDEYEWQVMAGDLSKATGDLHTSLLHYEKAQKINIKPGLHKDINALHLSIESESAIPILEEQLSQYPNEEQLIQLGKICLKFGNYRKAVNAFETAVKNYPQDAIPYYWLSETALKLNNPGKALSNIEKAITNDGANTQFICKKANILSKINGYAWAINFLDEELLKNNDSDDELLLLKTKLISENDGDKAALQFLNSIEKLQENSGLMLEKARLEFRIGDLNASEAIAENLLSQKDQRSNVLALLGLIAKERGELDRAIDFYIKAIEMNPFSTGQFIQLAEIYHDKKDFKRALETLEDGIKANPGSFGLLYKAGLYYYQHGLYSEAEKRINEAIKIEPDHMDAKDILGLLENALVIKSGSMITQLAE